MLAQKKRRYATLEKPLPFLHHPVVPQALSVTQLVWCRNLLKAIELDVQVGDLLTPLITDPDISIEVASFAAVALGLVFVATCHASSVEAILQVHLIAFDIKMGPANSGQCPSMKW